VAAIAVAGWLASMLAGTGAAAAENDDHDRGSTATADPTRSVAVLEFRGGSSALPSIAAQVSGILRARTSLTIVDDDDARARFGPALDQRVAECRGDGGCVARLGGRLEVDEVLLIGVSEFGDVILTMQRIRVKDSRVAGRVAEALAPGSAPAHAAVLGYLRRVLPRSDFVRFGILRIDANVAGARVIVGAVDRGATPIDPLRLPAPATYDIAVDKKGFVGFRATVDVPPNAIVKVRPTLSPKRNAWYEKWWVAALAGTAAVGVVTLGVLASRDNPDEAPVTIRPFE
jgi:hypothetical protein